MTIESDAIIFDLDGVLVDSTDLIEKHWRVFAEREELDPDYVLSVAHGRRTEDVLATLFPELDSATLARKLEQREGGDTDGLKTFDGVKRLLEELPDGHWAVATSGAEQTARTRLNFARLPIPEVLITAEQVSSGKPNPDVFLKAADGLGYIPARCVVIEDTPAGVEAARKAGMKAIAVETSHSRDELKRADAVIPHAGTLEVSLRRTSPFLALHIPPQKE